MNSKERVYKNKVDINDVFLGFLFLTTTSFFVSSYINAQMSDKSIYNSSQHLVELKH